MDMIIDEIMDRVEQVIDQVTGILPPAFPGDVATSIFDGMRKAKDMMIRSSEPDVARLNPLLLLTRPVT
jgi:hypothetical protein